MTNSEKGGLIKEKTADMIKLSEKRGAVYSCFLTGSEANAAEMVLKEKGGCLYKLYGVFENAERKMLCVHEDYSDPSPEEFPLMLVTFRWKEEYSLSHRDFLGAFMALGIKRETVGDIVLQKGVAQAAVTLAAGELILQSITKIGSVGVKVQRDSLDHPIEKKQEYKEINAAVASLRLDAVAGAALKQSRAKTAEIIKAVGVQVNYEMKYDCSYNLKESDIFSVRGYGKFILSRVSGLTKKGRIHIKLLKYC